MRIAALSSIVAAPLLAGWAAAATLVGTVTQPTGIQGLVVNGNSYDVSFSTKSYNDLFTGTAPPPIFATNPDAAFAAEGPLSGFLNSTGVTGLDGVPCALRTAPCMVFMPISPYTSPSGEVTTNGAFAVWTGSGWTNGAGDPGIAVGAPAGYAVCFPNGCDYYVDYAVFGVAASHTVKFNVTLLDAGPGGTAGKAGAMNNAGQVVGSLTDGSGTQQAAVWNGTAATILGPGIAVAAAINDSGLVVGTSPTSQPVAWTVHGARPLAARTGAANGVNASGRIVGFFDDLRSAPVIAPVQWAGATATAEPLVLPPAWLNGAVPRAVNGAGTVVGHAFLSCCAAGPFHAVRWSGSAFTDLGTLGGASSEATGINGSGYVAGWSDTIQHTRHAVLWGPHTRAFDLGTLGGNNSLATGINVEGDVVGSAQVASGAWHAVLWTHKHYSAVDLNGEVGRGLPAGMTLTEAVATNDKCRIAVNGVDGRTGASKAAVLSLTSQTLCDEAP